MIIWFSFIINDKSRKLTWLFFCTSKVNCKFLSCVLSGVQISFRRLTKVGATSKFWLKLTDVEAFLSSQNFFLKLTINAQFCIKNGGNLFVNLIKILRTNLINLFSTHRIVSSTSLLWNKGVPLHLSLKIHKQSFSKSSMTMSANRGEIGEPSVYQKLVNKHYY